ncbi:hypothetical protein D3C86_344250 [compost metagenome]
MSPMNQPQGHTNQRSGAKDALANSLKRFPVWLILGLALVGCGGEANPMVSPQSTYTTNTPYTDSYYTQPTTGTSGNTTDYSYQDNTLPIVDATPETTTPAVSSGVEVQLVSKDLPGMFSWERCEAQITVRNHESTPQQGYLFVRFTLKGREVELQYKVLSLTAKGSQSFQMKSTVQADDVALEYRTKLL